MNEKYCFSIFFVVVVFVIWRPLFCVGSDKCLFVSFVARQKMMKKNYGITRNARGTMSVSVLRLFVCSQTIYIYIFNSPFIELKFTKCQSIRLRCPVFFVFFVCFLKCVTFHCCIHLCIYPYTEIKLCVYRLYIEGLFIWNVCILKYMRTICCIYLKCKVQLFDNKRHTCYVEFRCGYFKWVETAKPLLKYSVLCI